MCVSEKKAEKQGETSFRPKSESSIYKVYFFLRGHKVSYLQCLMDATPGSYRSVCWACKRRCPLDPLTLEKRSPVSYERVLLCASICFDLCSLGVPTSHS